MVAILIENKDMMRTTMAMMQMGVRHECYQVGDKNPFWTKAAVGSCSKKDEKCFSYNKGKCMSNSKCSYLKEQDDKKTNP